MRWRVGPPCPTWIELLLRTVLLPASLREPEPGAFRMVEVYIIVECIAEACHSSGAPQGPVLYHCLTQSTGSRVQGLQLSPRCICHLCTLLLLQSQPLLPPCDAHIQLRGHLHWMPALHQQLLPLLDLSLFKFMPRDQNQENRI
jgi:hypothetical protein